MSGATTARGRTKCAGGSAFRHITFTVSSLSTSARSSHGAAVVCTENLASWHNIGALALGYQPFSLTNVSDVRPIGNRFALHAGEAPEHDESWQHVQVLTMSGLRDIVAA